MLFFAMEMGSMIAYAVMAVCVIGMIWALSASKKNPNMKVMFYVFFAVVIAALVVKTVFIKDANTEDERMLNNTRLVQMSRVDKVVSYISEKWPNGKVAFLVNEIQMNEQTEGDYLDKFVVAELKKALSEKGITCDTDISVGKMVKDPKTGEEVYEDPTKDATILTKALKPQIDKVDVVINFVGLPEVKGEADKIPFLAKKVSNNKNNMIVMVEQGLVYISEKLIDSGRVVYVVQDSDENFEFDYQKQDVPKDSAETFKLFYAFVDKDGFKTYKEKHPAYFPEEQE